MKRNKHVLINLTSDQFEALNFIADNLQRKTSDAAYLLIIDAINKEIIKHINKSGSDFIPLKYHN